MTPRIRWMFAGSTALLVAALLLAIATGPADIPLSTTLRALAASCGIGPEEDAVRAVDHAIVVNGRLPRALLAALVGAALALSGAQLQALFQNPLASPGVLGTSAGASFGAVLSLYLGWADRSPLALPLVAMAFGFASLLLVFALARRPGGTDVGTLLLGGIAVTSFAGALNAFVLAQAWQEQQAAQRLTYWMLGGLTDRSWSHLGLAIAPIALGLGIAVWLRRDLDPLLEGEEIAETLGVDVRRTRLVVLLNTAMLTGAAVAVSGAIGFVGLVIPHITRLLLGPQHGRLIPGAALFGATFLLLADVVARTVASPKEIHLGVVTAFVGAPFFAALIWRMRTTA